MADTRRLLLCFALLPLAIGGRAAAPAPAPPTLAFTPPHTLQGALPAVAWGTAPSEPGLSERFDAAGFALGQADLRSMRSVRTRSASPPHGAPPRQVASALGGPTRPRVATPSSPLQLGHLSLLGYSLPPP